MKRQSVWDCFQKLQIDVVFLQETHSVKAMERAWIMESKAHLYMSHGMTNSHGVAILICKSGVSFQLLNLKRDTEGRWVMLHISLGGQHFVLCNIYAPNEDVPSFFEQILENLDMFRGQSPCIFGGDFNLPLDVELDRYTQAKNPSHSHEMSHQMLIQWSEVNGFLDVWHVFHPDDHKYSWFTKTPCVYIVHLDWFFISEELLPLVKNVKIEHGFHSDHSAVSLECVIVDVQYVGSHWHFPNYLTKDLLLESYIDHAVKAAAWEAQGSA